MGRTTLRVRATSARNAAAGVALAVIPLLAAGATAASAQTTSTTIVAVPASTLDVTVNILGPLPPGVTGYRLDSTCRGVAGVAANEPRLATAQFPKEGGRATITIYLLKGANCAFRLTVLGTGPRPLSGNVMVVGGENRKVNFPTQVDGATVDPFTVIETDPIPLEASTTVIIGQNPATATTVAATTVAATTLAPTTVAATTTIKAPVPATTVATAPTPTTLGAIAPSTTVALVNTPVVAPTTTRATATKSTKTTTKKKTVVRRKTTKRR